MSKKQHYLPCVYLGNFSSELDRNIRKRNLYRNDGRGRPNVRVPIESQGVEDFYYGVLGADEVESDFGGVERDYGRIYQDVASVYPVRKDLKKLLAHFLVILTRGKAVQNLLTKPFYQAFSLALYQFGEHYLYDQQLTELRDERFTRYLQNRYVEVILTSRGKELITSDNPALVLTDNRGKSMLLGMLPLSPSKLLVIYDKTNVQFKQTRLSESDVSAINGLQAANSIQAVYSDTPLDSEALEKLDGLFQRRLGPNIVVEENEISYDFRLAREVVDQLSFVLRTST